MSSKRLIARIPGVSTTGIAHDVLIEATEHTVMVTIMGADGRKRHASSVVAGVDPYAVARAFGAVVAPVEVVA